MRDWVYRIGFYGCLAGIGVLSVVSLQSASGKSMMSMGGRGYAEHVLAYGVLAFFGMKSYPRSKSVILAAVVLYGVLLELVQWSLPHRSFNVYDAVANAAGCALVWIGMRWRTKRTLER